MCLLTCSTPCSLFIGLQVYDVSKCSVYGVLYICWMLVLCALCYLKNLFCPDLKTAFLWWPIIDHWWLQPPVLPCACIFKAFLVIPYWHSSIPHFILGSQLLNGINCAITICWLLKVDNDKHYITHSKAK